MSSDSFVILYHGTDQASALDILNHGLNVEHLRQFQAVRVTQLGEGWYTTDNVDVAWFFASIAPGTIGDGYTVIEMLISQEYLDDLLRQRLASKSTIINVSFQGEQYWFHPDTFQFLNEQAIFQPFTGDL